MENPKLLSDCLKQNTMAELKYRCEQCQRQPKAEGRKWCKRCMDVWYRKQTLTPEGIEQALARVVGTLYVDATFDRISEKVRDILLAHNGDVFFYGNPGVGKTFTMAALIRHYISEGHVVARINFDDFCCRLRSTMSPASKLTELDLITPLQSVDKLFIDDLALRTKQESDFSYLTFYTLLNKRQEYMLPTYISSNKNLKQIAESFDERIASRLSTALIINLTGEDKRRENTNKK